ncbi:MAG: hypothetical protein CMM45_03660 [Rhodospirillaceae bacterium]|nr:hypothetical protein [Rhodospirillaceae bacterium]|tara:strand:- start:368 stop:556 length:189 start_codon:yes stop_codon:yes gene_type:complete
MNIARLSAVEQKNSLARFEFLSRNADVERTARNALCSITKCKGGDEAVQEIHELIATPKAGT